MNRELPSISVDEAMRQLGGVESFLYATGAVDVEGPVLAAIRRDLLGGKISPMDAAMKAQKMMEGRQDYH